MSRRTLERGLLVIFLLLAAGGAFWRLAGREGLGLVGRRLGLPARLLLALEAALSAFGTFLLKVDTCRS